MSRHVFHALVSEVLANLIHRVLNAFDFLEVVDLLIAHLCGQFVFQNGARFAANAREGVGAGRLGRHRLHASVPLFAQMGHAELLIADVADHVTTLVAELTEDFRHLLIVPYGLPKRSNFRADRRDVGLLSMGLLEAVLVLEGDGVLRFVGVERRSVVALVHELGEVLLDAIDARHFVVREASE